MKQHFYCVNNIQLVNREAEYRTDHPAIAQIMFDIIICDFWAFDEGLISGSVGISKMTNSIKSLDELVQVQGLCELQVRPWCQTIQLTEECYRAA